MDALTHEKMSKALAVNELAEARKYLKYADGPAYAQSQSSIVNMVKLIDELDKKIAALTEAELFKQDRESAINRAVQIKQIKLIMSMMVDCWVGGDNEAGMTTTRYVAINNELSRALKELEA